MVEEEEEERWVQIVLLLGVLMLLFLQLLPILVVLLIIIKNCDVSFLCGFLPFWCEGGFVRRILLRKSHPSPMDAKKLKEKKLVATSKRKKRRLLSRSG